MTSTWDWMSKRVDEIHATGIEIGRLQELQRIINLLEELNTDEHQLVPLDGVIALIKGENKISHTHEIEVFGAPCDCGTRHEYCGDCDWVEPCEPEGENK